MNTEELTCNECKVFQDFKKGDSDNPCFETMAMNGCNYFEKPETEEVKK